ncbi:hypothetical protein [Desertibaculum subflavum]|uniref:hypothetical protein n=1 Tax=Desertibaculum subflavum TaxID=2268458 RepID=UPI0013C4E59F
MPVPILHDPELCETRSAEARALAAEAADAELRDIMVALAEEYEAMAKEVAGS